MNIRKKLLSVLAAAATLAASAAGALTLTAGAAEGVYDSAKVVWEGSLSVNSASVEGSFGSANARPSLDLSGKKYLLFTVENPTGVEADLFLLTLQSSRAANYKLQPRLNGKFEVLADGAATWTESTVQNINVAHAGPVNCLTVPAGNSVVRIPLDSSVLSGMDGVMPNGSAENDAYVLSIVDFVDCYVRAAGAGENKTVTLKKFAVTDTGFVPKVEPQGPTFAETDKIQLNPGEKAYFLTGFEDSDTLAFDNCSGEIVAEGANNGDKALRMSYTDGSAMGFKSFVLKTGDKNVWTGAKYIQFYLKNDSRCTNPLQLFYVKFAGHLLDYPAKGVMLYDMKTGKWTETTMQQNCFHQITNRKDQPGCDPDTGIYYVPSINIEAGFEGYVRIPLDAANFDSAIDLTNVGNIELYTIVEGTPGSDKAYIDDYALITYDGNKAPDYVDGKPKEEPKPPVEDELHTTFVLSGKVLDAQGKALANATVTMKNNSTADAKTFVTDKDGQFRFDGVKDGWAELTVVGADGADYGYITYTFTAVKTETKATGTNVDVNVDAKGLIVTIGMDTLGLDPTAVAEGVLEVTPGTKPADDGKNDDGKTDDGKKDDTPKTGVTTAVLPAAAVCAAAAAAAVLMRRKKNA